MKWLELHLDTQPAGIEPATELLSEYGIDSLMIDEEGDFKDFLENNHQYWDYVDDELMEQMHGKSRITFYLEDSAEGYNTLAQFRIGLSAFKKQHPEYAPLILSMENVEDADWENNWKQFYKPMEIGERLLVVPEWEQAQEDGRVKLVLNPGLTFGTGSHATTRLCLQALEQHIHGGEKVLDLGCGSGILSIAALLLGAKDAFVESVRVNTALLRRRVGKPSLKLWETMLGSETKTRVDILYIEGEAPPEQVERIKARLSLPDIPAVLAAGDVEQYLAGTPRGIFPQVIHTERPDRFVLGLARGKIGVLCDGLPIGFLLPAALPDMLRVQEDRARHAAVATALVLLRYLALFLSLALPALYVAIAMYHQEMIPYKLLQNVIDSKQSVPFSTAAETLGMLLSFELLQEAGIRLPDPVGQTVSVIGALIVGQSAVEAKVLSPIVIIVVAMAGIAGYAQPSQELGAAIRLWRVALVLGAVVLGLYGVMAGLMLLLWQLCDTENLGVSYLSPLTDSRPGSLRRAFLRPPLRKEDRK